jgi:transposase
VEQTLSNWVKAEKSGQLRGVKSEQVSAERDGEHSSAGGAGADDDGGDILGKATAYCTKVQR